jgi:hypothetical protein
LQLTRRFIKSQSEWFVTPVAGHVLVPGDSRNILRIGTVKIRSLSVEHAAKYWIVWRNIKNTERRSIQRRKNLGKCAHIAARLYTQGKSYEFLRLFCIYQGPLFNK